MTKSAFPVVIKGQPVEILIKHSNWPGQCTLHISTLIIIQDHIIHETFNIKRSKGDSLGSGDRIPGN
jgi:hypothetical protein